MYKLASLRTIACLESDSCEPPCSRIDRPLGIQRHTKRDQHTVFNRIDALSSSAFCVSVHYKEVRGNALKVMSCIGCFVRDSESLISPPATYAVSFNA